jgi:hypothetical protein
MPKNQNKTTVPTTDVPHLSIKERFEMLTEDEKRKVITFCVQLKEDRCNR